MFNILNDIGLKKIERETHNPYVIAIITGDLDNNDFKSNKFKFDILNSKDKNLLKEFVEFYKDYKEIILGQYCLLNSNEFITKFKNNLTDGQIKKYKERIKLFFNYGVPSYDGIYCAYIDSIRFFYINEYDEIIELEIC